MKSAAIAAAACITLSACVDVSDPPVVSDYNGHIVKVQDMGGIYSLKDHTPENSPAFALAIDTCKTDGFRGAKYQGFRLVGQYTGEHVFLCTR